MPSLPQLAAINFVNALIVKRAAKFFMRKNKTQQRQLPNVLLFVVFGVLLLSANYLLLTALSETNLYNKVGVSRKMSNAQIKVHIQQLKVDTVFAKHDDLKTAANSMEELEEIERVLTHNARRLTYDTFGMAEVQNAWAFMSPNFIISMLLSSSIYYLIALVLNIVAKDNKNSNLEGEIILIIVAFIWETETLMHSEDRFYHHPDMLDYIFTAFPIYQRRELLKYIITTIYMLLGNFSVLFVYNSAQTRLKELTEHIKPGNFLPIQDKVKAGGTKRDAHLEQNIQLILKQLSEKKGQEYESQKIETFRAQRELLRKFLTLENEGIFKDLKYAQILDQYALPFI